MRGSIETEYDENATVNDIVEGEKPYKFSNKSWINFVYKYSLGIERDVIEGNSVNSEYFDDAKTIFGDELIKTSDIIDSSKLISEGKLLPGDILSLTDGEGGLEYALYVGGTKILYATKPMEIASTKEEREEMKKAEEEGKDKKVKRSAIKYEYLQYYYQRVKRNLVDQQAESDTVVENKDILSKFGITNIYRIKESIANQKTQSDTSLIFAGKGYYSDAQYEGSPKEISYSGSVNKGFWLFSFLKQVIKFLINLVIYAIRMQVIGWANMFENLIQTVVLGISGHNTNTGWGAIFGTNATSASGNRITIESIFFNQIPILDANFFDFEEAGGRSLRIQKDDSSSESQDNSDENTEEKTEIDENNIVYQLRKNLANWYYIIRNCSIAIMLFITVYVGLRMALTSIAEKKANYNNLLKSFVYAFLIILFLHLYMYLVFFVNDTLVGTFKDLGQQFANTAVNQTQQEINMYDAVRTKAYAFDFTEGVPATIIYIFLIYLLVRFLLIYLKRYFTIYILAISGSFMGVKYAFEKISGRSRTTLGKWFKDFTFNVLLQTVHAFLYVVFMAVAISVSETSIAGMAMCLIILNAMLKMDKIIIKIFGLNKAGSLADVNSPESWQQLITKYYPMILIHKRAFGWGKKYIFGNRGVITEIKYLGTKADTYKDAEKALQNKKFEKLGKRWNKLDKIINKTPIKHLSKRSKYNALLNKDISFETKKKIYNSIQQAKKIKHSKFTRKVNYVKDLSLGLGGMVASVGVGIAEPTAGVSLFRSSKKRIDKYRSKTKKANSSYIGSIKKAKANKIQSKKKYNNILNQYTENQFKYEEDRNDLLDKIKNSKGDIAKEKIYKDKLKQLDKDRELQKSIEMNKLQEAYEAMYEDKVIYENAKHEKGIVNKALNLGGKFMGASVLDDIASNQTKQLFKDQEKIDKSVSKLKDLEKVANLEEELRKLNKNLNEYANKNGIKTEVQEDMKKIISESRRVNINSRDITRAVNSFMNNNNQTKIGGKDLDEVLDILQENLGMSGKDIEFSSGIKDKIRKQMEESMIKNNKALGYKEKDAVIELRKILGEDGVLDIDKTRVISDSKVNKMYNEILQKINEINTYDQIGKVKYKESLISINKIIKDAKKQGK